MRKQTAETAPSWRDPTAVLLFLWGIAVALLGYPPLGFWPLAAAGPAPLFAVTAARPTRAFAFGYAYGLGFFAALLFWLVHTLHVYGWLPLVVSVLLYLLLAAYLSLFPALAAWVSARVGRAHATHALLAAPFAWAAAEWLRARLFSGFGWGDLAQALWKVDWALDLAPRVGAEGVTLLLAMAASGLAWLLARLRYPGERPRLTALLPALVAFAAFFALRALPDGVGPEAGRVRAIVVQGNIDQGVKWDPSFRDRTIATYRSLTEEAAKNFPPDFVLWPETAVPLWVQDPSPARSEVERIAKKLGRDLVFGAPAYAPLDGDKTHRNAVFRMDRTGALAERYDKVHLVPFGEYVPFGRNFPFIHTLVQASGDFTPGEEPTRFRLGGTGPVLGPLICFESIFPGYASDHAALGAQILVLVTNDAWFGRTSAPYQHLAYAAWRAAEAGLPLLRAANTGVSAVFDARGRMTASTEIMVPAALTAEVAYPAASSPPQRYLRPLVGPLCLAGLFFAILRRR